MTKNKYEVHALVCPDCANKMYVPRKLSRLREEGHIKTMWCPYCKAQKQFEETRYFEDEEEVIEE